MLSQLFTLLPLFATALALPASSPNAANEVAARDGEYVYWKYYGDNGCHGAWLDDSAVGQSAGTGACTEVTPIPGANSFFVEHNDLTRTVRFHAQPGCQGSFVELQPGTTPNCYAQLVRSVRIL